MERRAFGGLAPGGGPALLSEGIAWGNLLFLSGRAAVDLDTLQVVSDDFEEQARHVLDQCVAALGEGGSGPEHVLRVQCYLLNAEDFAAWNRLWAEYFPPPRPVRTTICTGFAVPGMLIEVEVTAGVPAAASTNPAV